MFLLYVDEAGDVGLSNSPTDYFVLSGIAVHESRWSEALEATIRFRRFVRERYGLKLREEIHAAHFVHKPGELKRIAKSLRLRLLRDCLDFQASDLQQIARVFGVVIDKRTKSGDYDVFAKTWQALIQRFHKSIQRNSLPGSHNDSDCGMLVVDRTDEKKLRDLTRKMRRFNPVPSQFGGYRQLLLDLLVEDPVHRDSTHSYFTQLADVNAYFLKQKMNACSFVRRKGGQNYYDRLGPILITQASRTDPLGIVRL